MSSSDTEMASNRVPSGLVKMKKHIQFLRLVLSDGAQSLPEAVAEDVVDIFEKDHKWYLKNLFSFAMQ